MAEFIIGPLVSMLKQKASSYLLKQYKVMDGMEEQRESLERKLLAILDIIEDAEEKGAHRPGVSAWLEALKKVAYEANDIFDDFKYEALRRDAKAKGHYRNLGLHMVSHFPADNSIVFRYRMGKKLCRIVHIIEVLVAEMNAFGFKHLPQAPPSMQWRITDSIIIGSEEDIVSRSRSEEKTKIVNILIDKASDKDLTVLPIVGMGGLGKTTFAQLVYNDPEIKKYFHLQRWCCVSDDFDVAKIANSICQTNEKDRDKILQNLQKEVSGKRYLIVLDDVWNEDADKWEKLKTCLKHGGKGSAILMTTRKAKVAQIMKMCIDDSHNLGEIHKVFLKEIFENRAFCLEKPNAPELSDVVDKILDRCGGSPLAAKAFGSMLSNKTSMKEWMDVLNRSNTCNEKTGILPILKLSYDDLPSHMKQCFAFCAVFPKDYVIDVEILIQLWMAHDFVPLKEGDHEKVGREIFDELTWRSFFQDVKQTPKKGWNQLQFRTVCKIHDFMHDIALSVMGKDCVTIVDRPNQKELLSAGPTRHMFSSYDLTGTLTDDYLKIHSPSLQTLLYPDRQTYDSATHLSKYNHLRALQICKSTKLPLLPRQLQHLRYLDLSNNWHMDKITHLSLEWSDDSSEELDEHRNVLDALKPHGALEFLKIHSYKGTGFPTWVKSLSFLQHLTELHLNGCIMCEEFPQFGQFIALEVLVLKRLNKLRSLCGHSSSASFPALRDLTLENLEILERWVTTEGEEIICPLLENVQIKNCPKLTTLPIAPKPKVMNLAENKAQLSISIFRSTYMSYLSELFVSVRDTKAIPSQKLDQDREISISVMVLSGCNFLFPSSPLQPTVGVWKWFGQLVDLRIESCDMLIYWPEEEFRSLVLLKIFSVNKCNKLIGLTKVKGYRTRGTDQLLPNLKVLGIYDCGSLTELFVLPPSLTSISVWSCDSLEFIPGQDDRESESIQHFDTTASSEQYNEFASTSMPEQSSSPRIYPMPCLESLKLFNCKKLCFVSVQLNALLFLGIDACSELKSLDCLGDLPLLEELFVTNCKHLVSVPGSLGNYSALQKLMSKHCPAINMKPLYGPLQQRLDSLELKDISHASSSNPDEAGPKPKLWEPKSWKYAIPGRR